MDRATTWPYADPQEPEKACPDPVWPSSSTSGRAPGDGQRVLVLGDSLTKYAHQPLHEELAGDGWVPTIVCWGGTQTDWGLSEAKQVARERYIPDRVVVALGTNDVHKNPCTSRSSCALQVQRFGDRVEALLDYLGPNREVWWLTIDMDAQRAAEALGEPWNLNYPAFNTRLKEALTDYPNARVIDWHRIVANARASTDIRYTFDGLHYEPIEHPRHSAGTMLRVRTIVEALNETADERPSVR